MNRLNKYYITLLVALLGFSCKEDIPLEGAQLSPASLEMLEGSEAQKLYLHLYPSFTTEADVKWVSDNDAIASVTPDGMVTPLSPGKTRIRVFNGEHFLASSSITVTPFIHVERISLDRETINCGLGEAGLKLTAIVFPQDATDPSVTWSSSASDIVSVDILGNLTTHAEGVAVITATTVDGGKTASCTVTVTYEYVTGVEISPEDVTIYMGGASVTLTANILPANASNISVTWSSDDTEVVTVDNNGKLTAVSEGAAIVTVTTVEGGFTASCNVTVEAASTIGDNLLKNPGFEEPEDETNSIAGTGWLPVDGEWFNSYYPAGFNAATGTLVDRQKLSSDFFQTGNGSVIADIVTDDWAARFSAANTTGFYQLINVEPGKTYTFSVNIAIREVNQNQKFKDDETVKILSVDGMTDYVKVPIPTELLTVMTVAGEVTIPVGITQVRFQIDQRDYAQPPGPGRAPLMCADDCVFRLKE